MYKIKPYIPGFLFSLILIMLCFLIDKLLKSYNIHISVAFLCISIGLILNSIYNKYVFLKKFIQLSLNKLLRIGIALLGISISFNELLIFGKMSILLIIFNIIFVFLLLWFLSKYFKISKNLNCLIGMGTAICGVTAVIATSTIIKTNKNETGYAVAVITLFGLLTLFTYPYIAKVIFNDQILAGIFLGSAIHDTAQVSAAGLIYEQTFNSDKTLNSAITTKLLRNSFLIILIPLIAINLLQKNKSGFKTSIKKFFPLFVIGFIIFSCIRSIGDKYLLDTLYILYWEKNIMIIQYISKLMILFGMLSLGLQTNLKSILKLGIKPLIVGFTACITIALIGITYLKFLL